ncbi:MAG: hypothetical protein U1E46_06810 [Hyphomicrobiales bacterium]
MTRWWGIVITGLEPVILLRRMAKDGQVEPGHDERGAVSPSAAA